MLISRKHVLFFDQTFLESCIFCSISDLNTSFDKRVERVRRLSGQLDRNAVSRRRSWWAIILIVELFFTVVLLVLNDFVVKDYACRHNVSKILLAP